MRTDYGVASKVTGKNLEKCLVEIDKVLPI